MYSLACLLRSFQYAKQRNRNCYPASLAVIKHAQYNLKIKKNTNISKYIGFPTFIFLVEVTFAGIGFNSLIYRKTETR